MWSEGRETLKRRINSAGMRRTADVCSRSYMLQKVKALSNDERIYPKAIHRQTFVVNAFETESRLATSSIQAKRATDERRGWQKISILLIKIYNGPSKNEGNGNSSNSDCDARRTQLSHRKVDIVVPAPKQSTCIRTVDARAPSGAMRRAILSCSRNLYPALLAKLVQKF